MTKCQLLNQKYINIACLNLHKIMARGGDFLKKNLHDMFTKQRFGEELAEEIAKDLKKIKPNSSDTDNRR